MLLLVIFGWALCSVMAYHLFKWFTINNAPPIDPPSYKWRKSDRALGLMLSIIFGPAAVLFLILLFCISAIIKWFEEDGKKPAKW